MPIFSRKHYEVIAKLFAANAKYSGSFDRGWWITFADLFEKDNPKFNRLLFLEKCQETKMIKWKEAEKRDGD